jgi:acetylornithine deacetylase
MKAGLVAAWAAVRAVAASGVRLRGDVVLASVVGEEDGGLGTFGLLRHGVRADACVIPEPTGLDIVPANGGALTFRMRVPGVSTHASRRLEGVSAVEKFLPLLAALHRLEDERNAEVDPLMRRWSLAYPLSIGRVEAGDWASTVPDLLVAEGRLGVALGESVEQARASLERAVAQACDDDDFLRHHPATVTWWGGQFASGRTDPGHPLLATVGAAHAAITGAAPQVYGGPYGSDLRLLAGIGGMPTVQYGPGDTLVAHAADEWVDLAQVRTAAEVVAVLLLSHCGVA